MNSDDEDEEDLVQKQFKVILLGDGTVGKTSIAKRFSADTFAQTYKQTIGVDFLVRRIQLPPNYNVTLQLWDIGGQSIGSKMISNYISGADAILLCYDLTNYDSFCNLEDWYRIVMQTFEGQTLPCCALVANKTDLAHVSQVNITSHNKFKDENGLMSFQISAKSGDQVQLCFWKIAAYLLGIPEALPSTTIQSSIVPALIINSKQHDEEVNNGTLPNYEEKDNRKCLIS